MIDAEQVEGSVKPYVREWLAAREEKDYARMDLAREKVMENGWRIVVHKFNGPMLKPYYPTTEEKKRMEENEQKNSLGEPVADTTLEVKDGFHVLKLKFEPIQAQKENKNGSQ